MKREQTAAYVKAVRDKLHLKQEELGEKIGVSQQTISRYERGMEIPDVDIFMKLLSLHSENLEYYFAEEAVVMNRILKLEENPLQVYSTEGTDWNQLISSLPEGVKSNLKNFIISIKINMKE